MGSETGGRGIEPTMLDAASHTPLPRSFYERDVVEVARASIGTILVHVGPDSVSAGHVVEAEAYRGPEDLAAHTAGGRRTERNEVMWGPAGHAYLFQLYGIHWAFNAVTGAAGQPHAVLIRAIQPLPPFTGMAARRGVAPHLKELTNGPGKLCQALGLNKEHYGVDLCEPVLFLAQGHEVKVSSSPRINIDYAGHWAKKPWRFYQPGNPYVSVKPND